MPSQMENSKHVILIGMKSGGKTTTGRLLARELGARFIDMDAEIENLHCAEKGERLPFREIFKKYGGDYFRAIETSALRALASAPEAESYVLATGGGLPLAEENRRLLRGMGTIVFLDVAEDVLLDRIVPKGIPAFFPYPDDPKRSLSEILAVRRPVYSALAGVTVGIRSERAGEIAGIIVQQLEKHRREN